MTRSNQPQKDSPSYRIPALDEEFLLGDSMRGVRFLLEYAKAEEVFCAHRISSTIVVFGSARVKEDGPGRQPFWYAEARAFGRIASERGGALAKKGPRRNVIITGGGPGLMEAANRGADDAGAVNIGLNITLPREQEPNPYSTPDLTFRFHYFAMRKMRFAMDAAALVVFPGGFGTFDELFELLTLVQTKKMKKIPVVLFDRTFWEQAFNADFLLAQGLIAPQDTQLYSYADTAEEAWAALRAAGLEGGAG